MTSTCCSLRADLRLQVMYDASGVRLHAGRQAEVRFAVFSLHKVLKEATTASTCDVSLEVESRSFDQFFSFASSGPDDLSKS